MALLSILAPEVDDTVSVDDNVFTFAQHHATGTLTFASAVAGETFEVAGVAFTIYGTGAALNAAQNPAGLLLAATDTLQAAAAMDAIHAHPVTKELVRARYASGVLTVTALEAGEDGNALTLVGDTHITASDATLLGATDPLAGELSTTYPTGTLVPAALALADELEALGYEASALANVVTVSNGDGTDPAVASSDAANVLAVGRVDTFSRLQLASVAAAPDEGRVGDLVVVGGELNVCTVAQDGETPATYVVVGTQS